VSWRCWAQPILYCLERFSTRIAGGMKNFEIRIANLEIRIWK
jgi:hypothetical protein